MKIKDIHELSYNKNGGIDAVVTFNGKIKGKHPYTIAKDSDLEKDCLEGKHGVISDYVEDPQEEINKQIAELKNKLSETDFKMLPDYDEDNTEIKAQRKLWRKELRKLEG